jgi:hypothetical protein
VIIVQRWDRGDAVGQAADGFAAALDGGARWCQSATGGVVYDIISAPRSRADKNTLGAPEAT